VGLSPHLDDTAKTNMVLRQLHATNQAEIGTGKLAQERAQSSEIKEFATEMANEHASADQKLLDLAKRTSVDLTTTPQDPVAAALSLAAEDRKRALGALTGNAFDVAFLGPQVDSHMFALRLIDEGERTATGDTKKLLQELRPTIEAHRDHAKSLDRGLTFSQTAIGGGPTGSSAPGAGGHPSMGKGDAGHMGQTPNSPKGMP
jgi:putative membrane protein